MILSDGARGASRAPTRRRRPRAHAPPSPSCMVHMHEMHLRPGHHMAPGALSARRAAPTPPARWPMRVNALEFCWSSVEKQSRETERYSKRVENIIWERGIRVRTHGATRYKNKLYFSLIMSRIRAAVHWRASRSAACQVDAYVLVAWPTWSRGSSTSRLHAYALCVCYQSDLLLVCAGRPPTRSACSSIPWTPRAAAKRERSPDHTLVPRLASTLRRRRTPRERADACSTVAAASRCRSVYL